MIPSPLFQSLSKVWEGLKITGLGIGMVFLVLSILSLVIYLVGQAIYKAVSKEKIPKPIPKPPVPKPLPKAVPKKEEVPDEEIAAVIGAAIAAYLYSKAYRPKRKREEGGRDPWSLASRLESLLPEVEITRENLDEVMMEEAIWR